MLAARDQENLVHGHRTAAAAKALNQDGKALASRTPGHQAATFNGHGKATGRNRSDENTTLGFKTGNGKKNAFVTPIGMLSALHGLQDTSTDLPGQVREAEHP